MIVKYCSRLLNEGMKSLFVVVIVSLLVVVIVNMALMVRERERDLCACVHADHWRGEYRPRNELTP